MPAKSQTALRHARLIAELVPDQEFPLTIFHIAGAFHLPGAQHSTRHVLPLCFIEHNQERRIGVTARVVEEIRCRVLMMEFVQDDMGDRHPESAILPGVNGDPPISILSNLVEIGRKDHQLGPVVPRFGGEMHIRGARHAHVGADRGDELGVEPVGAFGYVRLFAPCFRAGRRQITVPVVKAHTDAAQHLQETTAAGITQHRHGRDRRKTDDAVGPIFLDGVDRGGGDDLERLSPGCTPEPTLAACLMKSLAPRFILDDGCPRLNRVLVHRFGISP